MRLSVLRFIKNTMRGGETMKKIVIGIAIVALGMFFGGLANAGDYHQGATLICTDCHIMHASKSHDYDGTTVDEVISAPAAHLLKGGGESGVCLVCHETGINGAPDVVEADTGTNSPANGRLGGALNKIATTSGDYANWKGHSIGSTDIAPGGTFTSTKGGLTCTECHSAHGGGSSTATTKDIKGNTIGAQGTYRNLASFTSLAGVASLKISYAVGTNDTNKDIFETASSGATHYDISNVNLNEPVTTDSAIGSFCKKCHTNFHDSGTTAGLITDGTSFIRHPTAGVDLSTSDNTQFGTHNYRIKVMSPTGDWGTQGATWTPVAGLTPTCTSCHKAHGNKNPFGLIYAEGAAPLTEEGDGTTVRSLCRQCHNKGAL